MERARARGAGRSGPPARASGLPRRGHPARGVRPRPARGGRAATPFLPRGPVEGHRVPGGLRGRRERPVRAARRDRRAGWLYEARRLALLAVELFADEARGGFFLTPADARGARRPQEGARRPPDAVRQLDAGLRPAPPLPHLRGRGAASGRRSPSSASFTPSSSGRRRRWGTRSAPSTCTSRPRGRSRSSAPRGTRSHASHSRRSTPNAVVAFGPADDVPLLEGKTEVDGRPAVYVCERFACQAPVTDAASLESARRG